MGTLSLTDPANGTTADATLIATNNAAIKAVVNGGIDDANIAPDAAVAASKIANYPSDSSKFLAGDGTWVVPVTETELDYVERTTSYTLTGSLADVITGNSITLDGSTRIKVEWWCPGMTSAGGNQPIIHLNDGSTDLGVLFGNTQSGGQDSLYAVRFLTPSAAAHTYKIQAAEAGGTGVVLNAGAGGAGTVVPMFLRVTRAVAA